MKRLTDTEIIEGITASQERSDQVIESLWRDKELRNLCFGVMRKVTPLSDDLEEIFDESLLIFRKAVLNQKYAHRGSVQSFIAGICKFLALKKYRREKNVSTRENSSDHQVLESIAPPDPVDAYASIASLEVRKSSAAMLSAFIARLSEGCKENLQLYYFQERTIKDIAATRGQNTQSVKNALQRCRETLRGFILASPEAVSILKSRLHAGI